MKIISLFIGGGLGVLLRYYISFLNTQYFAFGTLVANLIGSFLIGFLATYFNTLNYLPEHIKLLIITGFLGALTTFSTFSFEFINYIFENKFLTAAIHLLSHLFGSILFTIFGIILCKVVFKS